MERRLDSQIAWLINEGVNHLTSGKNPIRRGNGHPNIVPYQVFAVSDGHAIIAVGNDTQFQRYCAFLGLDIADDPRFATNPARLENRDALISILVPEMAKHTMADVIAGLEASKVPVGPVQTLDQVFGSDQVAARDMIATIPRDDVENGAVRLIGNPLKMSKTPVTYRKAPPRLGQDTAEVIAKLTPND